VPTASAAILAFYCCSH